MHISKRDTIADLCDEGRLRHETAIMRFFEYSGMREIPIAKKQVSRIFSQSKNPLAKQI